MKVKLHLRERFQLIGLLPPTGSIATMRVRRDTRMALAPSEDEIARWNIRDADGGTVMFDTHRIETDLESGQRRPVLAFDPDAGKKVPVPLDLTAEVEIGTAGMELLVKALKEADRAGRLGEEHIDLYERFVESEAGKE